MRKTSEGKDKNKIEKSDRSDGRAMLKSVVKRFIHTYELTVVNQFTNLVCCFVVVVIIIIIIVIISSSIIKETVLFVHIKCDI